MTIGMTNKDSRMTNDGMLSVFICAGKMTERSDSSIIHLTFDTLHSQER
jgi:hypothetical protein